MKYFLIILFSLSITQTNAQNDIEKETAQQKLVIVTIDGYRWQEVFRGADSVILHNANFVSNVPLAQSLFWANNTEERKNKLMPFLHSITKENGFMVGNRDSGSYAKVTNPYKISYAGYSELFTGHVNLLYYKNKKVFNTDENILHKKNKTAGYENSVAAFVSWATLPYVLNASEFDIPCYNNNNDTITNVFKAWLPNTLQCVDNAAVGSTSFDALTALSSMEYIKNKHPKIVYIGYGETDIYAHKKMYDQYLLHAKKIDQYLAELWYYLQTDPFYKDNTTIIITTDHGRGNNSSNWFKHNILTTGSGQTWLAVIGAKKNAIIEKGLVTNNFKQTEVVGLINQVIPE